MTTTASKAQESSTRMTRSSVGFGNQVTDTFIDSNFSERLGMGQNGSHKVL